MNTVNEISYAELAKVFVEEMLALQKKKSGDLYVGLSGGSTLPPLLAAIANTENAHKLSQVVFTFIDERLVPYDVDGSNFGAMKEAIESLSLRALPLPCSDSLLDAKSYQQKLMPLLTLLQN